MIAPERYPNLRVITLHWTQSREADISSTDLSPDQISAIVEMALSDHVSFANIEREFGLPEKGVKALMRSELKAGSYRAWRKRVRTFSDRREHYK